MLAELREELRRVDEAIASVERLVEGKGRRRGRPPLWLGARQAPLRKPERPSKRAKPAPKDTPE